MHFKYWFKVKAYDDAINEEKHRRKEAGEELTEDDEAYYLSLRLDEGHLFPLQLIDLVISFIHSCGDKEVRACFLFLFFVANIHYFQSDGRQTKTIVPSTWANVARCEGNSDR